MSYDPKIGRWISEDPIGFQAADPNLYRYVENNPTNLIDPSGLDDILPSTKLDDREFAKKLNVNYSKKLVDSTIPFGSCGATISVNLEHWRIDDNINAVAQPFMNFTVTLGNKATDNDKKLLQNTYWLQIGKVDRYTDKDKTTLDNNGSYKVLIAPKAKALKKDSLEPEVKFGQTFLDTSILKSPYSTDTGQNPNKRTETSLTYWDGPDAFTQTNKKYPVVTQTYELYLIVGGKAAYVVHWSVDNYWNDGQPYRQFKVSAGRVPTSLPDFLSDPKGKLFRGKMTGFLDKNPDIDNPVKGVVP